jgi:hypothetical protein
VYLEFARRNADLESIMRINGEIRPKTEGGAFTREAWCQFVSRRPECRSYPAREIRNPFTSELTVISAPEDAVEVLENGTVVGKAYWSMSEEKLVNVDIEPSALHLVLEWANALGGEFRAEPQNEES